VITDPSGSVMFVVSALRLIEVMPACARDCGDVVDGARYPDWN
jgi:hypothetical protein